MPQLPSRMRSAVALILGLGSLTARGQAPAIYLETGLGRRSGDFGTPTTSTLLFGYGTVGYASTNFDLSMTLPVLRLRTTGGGADDTTSGTGDIILRGVRRLVGTVGPGFSLDGGLAVKLPTASESQGLGTGQMDLGAFLAPRYRIGNIELSTLGGWIKTGGLMGGMSSSMMGNGATSDGAHSGVYVLAAGASLFSRRTKYSLAFEARGAQFTGNPGPREISTDVFHLFTPKWAMKASAFVGLSNGGPKNGLGLAIVYWP